MFSPYSNPHVEKIRKYTVPYSQILPGFQEIGQPVWTDKGRGIISVGEFDPWHPDWDNWYWNIKEYARANMAVNQLRSAGVEDSDPMGTRLAGVNPQLYGKAQELMYAVDYATARNEENPMKYLRSAAIIKREDFMAFKTIVAQTKILAVKPRKHIILEMIPVDNVSEFDTKIYSFDGPWDMVQENLPELNIPDITGIPNFTPMTFGMERNAMHWAFSEEFLAQTFDFNIKDFVIKNVAGQFEAVFNKKAADVINNSSTLTGYGDWKAKTGGVSDRDPSEDINVEATKLDDTLKTEGVIMASQRKVYNAYLGNTYNNGWGTPTYKHHDYSFGNAIVTNIPHFTGLDWGIDTFFAANKVFLFDPAAIYAAQMPERTVDYKSQFGTHQGTIVRKNMIVKPLDTSRMLGLSGVTV